MSDPTSDLEPLDADLRALLDHAKPLADAPNDARARMWQTLESRLPTVANVPAKLPKPSFLAAHPMIALSAAFVLGGVVGAIGRGAPKPEVITVIAPATVVVRASIEPSAMPIESAAPIAIASAASTSPVASAATPAKSAPLDRGEQLAAESALLDVARLALAAGEPDRVLEATSRHAAQFPHGLLSEEREAMAVKALAMKGDADAAKARAAKFREKYPGSLMQKSVEQSVAP